MSYLFRYRLPLETQPSRSRLDPSIDIDNFPPPKQNIERFNLHNFESSQYSLDTESTTLLVEFELNNTFNKKDYSNLVKRCKEIFEKNYWLLGNLVEIDAKQTGFKKAVVLEVKKEKTVARNHIIELVDRSISMVDRHAFRSGARENRQMRGSPRGRPTLGTENPRLSTVPSLPETPYFSKKVAKFGDNSDSSSSYSQKSLRSLEKSSLKSGFLLSSDPNLTDIPENPTPGDSNSFHSSYSNFQNFQSSQRSLHSSQSFNNKTKSTTSTSKSSKSFSSTCSHASKGSIIYKNNSSYNDWLSPNDILQNRYDNYRNYGQTQKNKLKGSPVDKRRFGKLYGENGIPQIKIGSQILVEKPEEVKVQDKKSEIRKAVSSANLHSPNPITATQKINDTPSQTNTKPTINSSLTRSRSARELKSQPKELKIKTFGLNSPRAGTWKARKRHASERRSSTKLAIAELRSQLEKLRETQKNRELSKIEEEKRKSEDVNKKLENCPVSDSDTGTCSSHKLQKNSKNVPNLKLDQYSNDGDGDQNDEIISHQSSWSSYKSTTDISSVDFQKRGRLASNQTDKNEPSGINRSASSGSKNLATRGSLRKKLSSISTFNPYLNSIKRSLSIKNKDSDLPFRKSISIHTDNHTKISEDLDTSYHIHGYRKKNLKQYNICSARLRELYYNCKTPTAADCLQSHSNVHLARFTIIRDSIDVNVAQKIVIILSVNHILADSYTVYRFLQMLNTENKVQTLHPRRIDYQEMLLLNSNLFVKKPIWNFWNKNCNWWCFGRRSCFPEIRYIRSNLLLRYHQKLMLPLVAKAWSRLAQPRYHPIIYRYKLNMETLSLKLLQARGKNSNITKTDVILAWFYSLNPKSDNVLFGIDLRKYLDLNLFKRKMSRKGLTKNSQKCKIAGNYLTYIPLRKNDLSTCFTIRERIENCFNPQNQNKKFVNPFKMPTFKEFLNYPFAVAHDLTQFHQPIKIKGFNLNYMQPLLEQKYDRLFGFMEFPCEDNITIFNCDNRTIAVEIITGSCRIDEGMLEGDPMLGQRISRTKVKIEEDSFIEEDQED